MSVNERPLHNEVLVSKEAMASKDAYDVIMSNISVVNALKDEYFRDGEQAPNAMLSYRVDQYLAEVNNGGFSQFVYNTRWDPAIVGTVAQGLEVMGATRHRELFRKSKAAVEALGARALERFFDSGYFGDNRDRDALAGTDADFAACEEQESLIELSSRWLRSVPNLRVVPRDALPGEITRLAALITDRDARRTAALAAEPRFKKLIRALCVKAGHAFKTVTAGSPMPRERRIWGLFTRRYNVIAWHFHTDRGLHYMIDDSGIATMYEKATKQVVVELSADASYGP